MRMKKRILPRNLKYGLLWIKKMARDAPFSLQRSAGAGRVLPYPRPVSNIDFAFKYRYRWPRHQDCLFWALPIDDQFTAMGLDRYRRIERTAQNACNHGSAGASAACQCFAGATFEYAQIDMVAVDYLHEAGIDAFWKARMMFDERSIGQHWCGFRIVDDLHRVRVAHRYHRDPGSLAIDLQWPQCVLGFCLAMQSTWIEWHLWWR